MVFPIPLVCYVTFLSMYKVCLVTHLSAPRQGCLSHRKHLSWTAWNRSYVNLYLCDYVWSNNYGWVVQPLGCYGTPYYDRKGGTQAQTQTIEVELYQPSQSTKYWWTLSPMALVQQPPDTVGRVVIDDAGWWRSCNRGGDKGLVETGFNWETWKVGWTSTLEGHLSLTTVGFLTESKRAQKSGGEFRKTSWGLGHLRKAKPSSLGGS